MYYLTTIETGEVLAHRRMTREEADRANWYALYVADGPSAEWLCPRD